MTSRMIIALAASAALLGAAGCSSNKVSAAEQMNEGIGVNGFLWRAALDTLSFMPLSSADPWGGVIITDWYANPEEPSERFKATVYILDTRLRADGVSVAISRQVRGELGDWITAEPDPDTRLAIENAILTRARQLRLAALDE